MKMSPKEFLFKKKINCFLYYWDMFLKLSVNAHCSRKECKMNPECPTYIKAAFMRLLTI